MLHEYRELITELKGKNARFDAVFEKHNQLDKKILDITEGREHLDDFELDKLKKEKLRLKDEAYAILLEYKAAQK